MSALGGIHVIDVTTLSAGQTAAATGFEQLFTLIYRDLSDEPGLRQSCKQLKANGFFGQTCVHPKQISAINQEFETSEAEFLEAQKALSILKNSAGVSTDSDSRMIDEASARIARRTISRKRPAAK